MVEILFAAVLASLMAYVLIVLPSYDSDDDEDWED